MQITFTGIKNIAYDTKKDTTKQGSTKHFFNAQLTDDVYGKDLTEYKNILKDARLRSGDKNINFSHPEDSSAINIKYIYNENDKSKELYINGIPLDNEHTASAALHLLIFANKLTDKIRNLTFDKMVVNKDYIDSYEADNGIWLGEDVSRISECFIFDGEMYRDYMNTITDKKEVKKGNNYIGNAVTNFLTEFLLSTPKKVKNRQRKEVSFIGGLEQRF